MSESKSIRQTNRNKTAEKAGDASRPSLGCLLT
jgi:hypothetical protein